jgi:hypothetical protein
MLSEEEINIKDTLKKGHGKYEKGFNNLSNDD